MPIFISVFESYVDLELKGWAIVGKTDREGGRKRESRKGKKKEERKERRKEEERVSKQNKSVWGRLSGHVAATLSGVHVHCLPQEHHSFPLQTLVLLLPSFVVKPEQ